MMQRDAVEGFCSRSTPCYCVLGQVGFMDGDSSLAPRFARFLHFGEMYKNTRGRTLLHIPYHLFSGAPSSSHSVAASARVQIHIHTHVRYGQTPRTLARGAITVAASDATCPHPTRPDGRWMPAPPPQTPRRDHHRRLGRPPFL